MAQGVTERVFRCFCNCSDLTEREIQDIVMGHTGLVFSDPRVKQMFRAYIDKFHHPRSSGAYKRDPMCLKYITCYEISQELLNLHPSDRMEFERNEELFTNCPSYQWEKILTRAIDDEDHPEKLEELLDKFMQELKNSFEEDVHNYYGLFKEELTKKLQQK